MTVSLDFDEAYLDPESAFARYRRAMLWNPQLPGRAEETLLDFVTVAPEGAGAAWRAFPLPLPELGPARRRRRARLWTALCGPAERASLGADGRNCRRPGNRRQEGQRTRRGRRLRDRARSRARRRADARGGMVDGRRILSEGWLRDTLEGGDAEAWRQGDFRASARNGPLPQQMVPDRLCQRRFLCASVSTANGSGSIRRRAPSMVKFSSQPVPVERSARSRMHRAFPGSLHEGLTAAAGQNCQHWWRQDHVCCLNLWSAPSSAEQPWLPRALALDSRAAT